MLLPTTLPTAMSRSPRRAAITEVATSGSDVPAAITVRPMTSSDTPRARARTTAPSTMKRAPTTSSPSPPSVSAALGSPPGPGVRPPADGCIRDLGDRFRLAAADPDRPHHVDHQPGCQQRPFQAPEPAIEGEQPGQQRHPDHHRHVEAHELARHGQRHDERREPEDQQDIEDVGPHDVAHRDVGLPGQAGPDADRQLRSRGAERHHGEADDQGRDAGGGGHPHRAPHQQLGPHDQQQEPTDKQESCHTPTSPPGWP